MLEVVGDVKDETQREASYDVPLCCNVPLVNIYKTLWFLLTTPTAEVLKVK